MLGGASPPSGGGALSESGELLPAPVPATTRTGGAMHNNGIHRPNVVTSRAATEPTGAVIHYRGVRPSNNNDNNNNNKNNHTALAERFQPSTLHKLRQLGLYINTDTLDIAHQLDAEAVAAVVTYTRTNTQPNYSGGGKLGCIPSTVDCESGEARCLQTRTDSLSKKRAITISQKDYTEAAIERYHMEGCNSAYTPGVGPELSLNQLEEKLLDEEGTRRYQGTTGAVVYLEQITHYDIFYAVN